MKLIEGWGTGLPRLYQRCKEMGLQIPKFEEAGDGIRVTVYRSSPLGSHKTQSREHNDTSKENDSTIDKANQKLLASIKQDDTFRTHGYIEQVLKAADMLSVRSVEVSAMSEINYVDSLFGYKPLSKVKETIQVFIVCFNSFH